MQQMLIYFLNIWQVKKFGLIRRPSELNSMLKWQQVIFSCTRGFPPDIFYAIPNRDRLKAFQSEFTDTCSIYIITYELVNIAYNCVFYQVVVSVRRCNDVGTYPTVIWSNSMVASHGIKWRVALGQEFSKVWNNPYWVFWNFRSCLIWANY